MLISTVYFPLLSFPADDLTCRAWGLLAIPLPALNGHHTVSNQTNTLKRAVSQSPSVKTDVVFTLLWRKVRKVVANYPKWKYWLQPWLLCLSFFLSPLISGSLWNLFSLPVVFDFSVTHVWQKKCLMDFTVRRVWPRSVSGINVGCSCSHLNKPLQSG